MKDARTDPSAGEIYLPTGRWGVPPEEHRQLRGHDFYPSLSRLAQIPALQATDGAPEADQIMHIHYTLGGADWYVAELDPETGTAFGWVRITDPEYGYIPLPELERVQLDGGRVVRRDRDFMPVSARHIPAIAATLHGDD